MCLQDRLLLAAKTALDVSVVAAAFCLAFLIRFEGAIPGPMLAVMLVSLPCVLIVKCVCLATFGVHRLPWRCVSLFEGKRIFLALLVAAVMLACMRLTAAALSDRVPALAFLQVPLGVLAIDFAVALIGACGARVGYRLFLEWRDFRRRHSPHRRRVRTLLVGTTPSGVRVAGELVSRPDSDILPLGFVGEGPSKIGMVLHGLPVLGLVDDVQEVIRAHGAEQVLITAGDVEPAVIRRLVRSCETSGVKIKLVPDGGQGGVADPARVRDVCIEDLLRRDVIRLGGDGVADMVRGRTVLVTGAGGSIGSELCRAVCRLRPAKLVLVEQAENNLFLIHRELAESFPGVELEPCIADICDAERMRDVLEANRPSALFHAAAHKHVPLMEWNPGEAVKNNVLGTRGLADLADAAGVDRFVMVSTDKAVNPSSVMGVAKRVAEMYIQALSQRSRTRFVTVRFGNVLGSSGSVIPIFQDQILKGGPVTVTHPEMKRYFMTIPEACQLVLEAAALGQGGEIFILDMGEPVKIVDLAYDLIRLAGLVPERDIKVRFTGVRPGEKLFEEIALQDEHAERTRHPRIYIGKLRPHDWDEVSRQIDELGAVASGGDPQAIRAKFKELVPEYQYPVGAAAPQAEPAEWPAGREVGPDRRTPVVGSKSLKASTVAGEG